MQEEVIINKLEENNTKLRNMEEKQDIIGDSLQNKYNQLSKTMGKIHQNVKSQNNKFSQIMETIKQINMQPQEEISRELENKITQLIKQLENQNQTENHDYHHDKQVQKNELNYNKYMYKWFNKNLKITKNPNDVIDLEELKTRLEKHIRTNEEEIDTTIIYNKIESYLKYWYNKHNNKIIFEDIITKTISNKTLYAYLKYMDLKEERENRIKNTIIAWLKENTCEIEGSRTYTEDILRQIQPLFEDHGWIITTPDEYSQLQQAGFTKVCIKRTFSQIIGKAVQDYYSHINNETIKRDTPENGYITWYPNIQIIDKKVSDALQSTIKDQLNKDIFDSDNIICKWLNNNITYTGNTEDKIQEKELLDKVRKHLKQENAMIQEDTLQRLLTVMLEKISKQYNVIYEAETGTLSQFKLNQSKDFTSIMVQWLKTHLKYTGNAEDQVSVESLEEKLLTTLYKKNNTIIKDNLYQQIPEQLKNNFTPETQYKDALNDIIKQKVQGYDEEKRVITKTKITTYKNLKQEDITTWVNNNIEQLLKNNITNKKTIINNFNQYLTNNNTKNNTKQTTEQLLDHEIQKHYQQQNITLKQLNDTQDTYYAIIK